mgnify:CR=1 FL=1
MDKISTQYNYAVQLIKSAILQSQLDEQRQSTNTGSHSITAWANMSLTTHVTVFGGLEP